MSFENVVISETSVLICSFVQCLFVKLLITQLVPVEVVSIVQQSLEGVQTPLDPSNSSGYTPQLVQPARGDSPICNNVVLQV